MSEILALSKRHIKNYYRDKTAVFFSFLSVIILLAIYIFFLSSVFDTIPFSSDINKTRFMMGYIMGGVLVVNVLTLSLGVIGSYVNDFSTKKINGVLVSPVKRSKLTISYFVSTFTLTLLFTLLMFAIVYLYVGISGYWFGALQVLQIIGTISLYVLISTPLILLIASFINSMNAFGGVSTLVGTLIGFMSGIYVPLAILGDFIKGVASVLPFSHMTIYLRRLLIGEDLINTMPMEVVNENSLNYLEVFGANINIYLLFGVFTLISLGMLVLSYFRINKKSA